MELVIQYPEDVFPNDVMSKKLLQDPSLHLMG
jgi:hypothetical protein